MNKCNICVSKLFFFILKVFLYKFHKLCYCVMLQLVCLLYLIQCLS